MAYHSGRRDNLRYDPDFLLLERLCWGARGAPLLNFTAAQVWAISAFYGAWVIPALLALIDRPAANWASLVFGGILVVLTTLSGVFDGIRDGGHLVFLALLVITLPGSFAIAQSWRRLQTA